MSKDKFPLCIKNKSFLLQLAKCQDLIAFDMEALFGSSNAQMGELNIWRPHLCTNTGELLGYFLLSISRQTIGMNAET